MTCNGIGANKNLTKILIYPFANCKLTFDTYMKSQHCNWITFLRKNGLRLAQAVKPDMKIDFGSYRIKLFSHDTS